MHAPSAQQQGFYDWVSGGTGSAALIAVAGAGKTTTLIEALGRMAGSVYFGAYNRKIADEIRGRVRDSGLERRGLFVGTMHSAGLSAFRRAYPRCEVDGRKVQKILDRWVADGNPDVAAYASFMTKMVSLGKQFLMGVERDVRNLCVWRKLVRHFSLAEELPEDVDLDMVLALVVEVFEESRASCPQAVDFDDMVYAPIAYDVRFYRNDWVLVDEAQDLNRARRELARRMLAPGGRLVAVGDPRQAIYGFTGAGADSIDLIVREFGCEVLPLTVTYRCPKAVVAYAQRWVSHIQAHGDAPEGVVRSARVDVPRDGAARPWFVSDAPGASDAVLCRYTRPLVETAYALLREGHACRVEGRDIGTGLVRLATRWKVKTLDALDRRLSTYLKREVAKARASGSESAEQAVADRVATLRIFAERCAGEGTVAALVVAIEGLFADDVTGVTVLSTIHKSKGREWDRVYWLQAAPRGRRALQPWEQVQEDNLCYVAATRAKAELVLVEEGRVT